MRIRGVFCPEDEGSTTLRKVWYCWDKDTLSCLEVIMETEARQVEIEIEILTTKETEHDILMGRKQDCYCNT